MANVDGSGTAVAPLPAMIWIVFLTKRSLGCVRDHAAIDISYVASSVGSKPKTPKTQCGFHEF